MPRAAKIHATIRREPKPRLTAHQRGYTGQWQKARAWYLKQHPLCRMCGLVDRVRSAVLVDHIVRHRGNQDLFWREDNWQALCRPCHDIKTAFELGRLTRPLHADRWVLTGRPGTGKTTWLNAHEADRKWDADTEAVRRGYTPRYPRPQHEVDALAIARAELLDELLVNESLSCLVIVTNVGHAGILAAGLGARVKEFARVWRIGSAGRAPPAGPLSQSETGEGGHPFRGGWA